MKAVLVILFVGCVSLHGLGDELVPDAFIDVRTIAPDIQLEMRYVTDDNFVGAPVDGYLDPICYLARPAAAALAKVQEAVQERWLRVGDVRLLSAAAGGKSLCQMV